MRGDRSKSIPKIIGDPDAADDALSDFAARLARCGNQREMDFGRRARPSPEMGVRFGKTKGDGFLGRIPWTRPPSSRAEVSLSL